MVAAEPVEAPRTRSTPASWLVTPFGVMTAVLVLLAIRLLGASWIDLHPDETYYWTWSRHLAASYYDHPPMVAWWIAAGTSVFADNPFGTRAFFVGAILPTSVAVYITGRVLFDKPTAALGVLWLNASLLIGTAALAATPDAPSTVFWSLSVMSFVLAVKKVQPVWWLAVGLGAGLGVLSKLTNLFLGLGLVLPLLAFRDLRRWLKSPWLYAGGAVALLVVLPMILWNRAHGWITFAKQFSRLDVEHLELWHLPEFLAVQFGLLNPLIAVFLCVGIWVWARKARSATSLSIGLLATTTLPIVAYMTVHSLRGRVEGNWLAPIYPTLALIAAAGAQSIVTETSRRLLRVREAAFPVGVALSCVGLFILANPGNIIPAWFDVFGPFRGWAQFARSADDLREKVGAGWIATGDFALQGELSYQLRNTGTPVIPVLEKVRYAFVSPPDDSLRSQPALFLIEGERPPPSMTKCFASLTEIGRLQRQTDQAKFETFVAYLAVDGQPAAFNEGCEASMR